MTVTFAPALSEPTPRELIVEHGFPETMIAHHESLFNVNVSNVNAVRLLAVLGYELDVEEGAVGRDDADAFLGRVLVALAVEPYDEGVEMHQLTVDECAASPVLAAFGAGRLDGPAVYDCGRRKGYTQERLKSLQRLATYCRDVGALVAWA